MKKFKIAVIKNQKKFNLVLRAENEHDAKERVHSEGYSILNIEEFNEENFVSSGETILFEGFKDGEFKKGKVLGSDIFKTYLKLRKDLKYDVKKIYRKSETDISAENLSKILKELEAEYNIYLGVGGKIKQKAEQKAEEILNPNDVGSTKIDNFYLKKELDDTYKLIDFVLTKISKVIDNTGNNKLSGEQLEKIKNVYNSIIKVKKTTNISKLRQVGELALLKVGEIELRMVETDKSEEAKAQLKETNKLLKDIGSNKHFTEKNKDPKVIIGNYLNILRDGFKSLKRKKKSSDLDKKSYSYIKNLLVLKKYKEKLKSNHSKILKNIFVFIIPFGKNEEKRDLILLERTVLKQNIKLLTAKNKGSSYSYTTAKQGYTKMLNRVNRLFGFLRKYLFISLLIYSIFFVIYFTLNYISPSFYINLNVVYYILVLTMIYLFLLLSNNFIKITLYFGILSFLLLFSVINF